MPVVSVRWGLYRYGNMFLKETTVRRGKHRYVYVQVVEGYRDERGRVRQRVVANLGRREKLKASGELDRLAAAFTRLDPPPAGTRVRCGALALVACYLRRLGLAAAVDAALPARGRAQLTHGEVICALVANRLCDPRPLYDIRGWADEQGAHPLVGTPAALLNDDRLGRALDALAGVIDQVKGALCLRALERFGCEPKRLHWDFTSVAVYGSHRGSALIRFGHSSDKKAHLRQAKLGQAVSEDGVALYHRTENGARNETAVEQLERVKRGLGGRHYPDQKAVERKLAQILQGTPARFITTKTGERADGKPTLSFQRDQDAIADAERVDGIYCLITSLPAEHADHAALLAHFKEQERIE